MIEVKLPTHGILCNSCFSRNGVKEIEIHSDGTGQIMRLCADCRKELVQKLDDDFAEDEREENAYREEANRIAEEYGD